MKATVKTFWICMLLMLIFYKSGDAINFTAVHNDVATTCEISVALFSVSQTPDTLENGHSQLGDTKFAWSTDAELNSKPITEIYSSNQQRLRRVLEDNVFLRNILLKLSDRENMLVLGKTKLYYSDKDPFYALTGSDYYIYTLRRILI